MRLLITAFVMLAYCAMPVPTQAGLVSWWTMDGDTNDSIGGFDASSANTDYVSGVGIIDNGYGPRDFGSGLQFDSLNDTFVPTGFSLPQQEGTLSMWIKPAANDLRRMVFYYQGDAADANHNGFGHNDPINPVMEIHTGLRDVSTVDGTKAQFYVTYQDGVTSGDNGPGRATVGSALLDPSEIDGNTWYNLVVSWGRTTNSPDMRLRMYLNGVLQSHTSLAGKTWANLNPAVSQFGQVSDPGTTTRFFNGVVDDIAVWDYHITAASAAALYNGASPDNILAIVPTPEPGSLLLSALGGVLVWRKSRRRKQSSNQAQQHV